MKYFLFLSMILGMVVAEPFCPCLNEMICFGENRASCTLFPPTCELVCKNDRDLREAFNVLQNAYSPKNGDANNEDDEIPLDGAASIIKFFDQVVNFFEMLDDKDVSVQVTINHKTN